MNSCYIGAATDECQYGLRNPEVGYRIIAVDHNFDDPRHYQNDTEGTPIGFRAGHQINLEATVRGRICGEAPIDITALPFQFPCAGVVAFANLINGYGVTAGGIYMSNLQFAEADETDAEVTATLTRHPQIA